METTFNVVLGFAIFVALMFIALIYFTSKGDAMSGGSGVRTTFKGKAGFDDFVSKMIIFSAAGFFLCLIVLDALASRIAK